VAIRRGAGNGNAVQGQTSACRRDYRRGTGQSNLAESIESRGVMKKFYKTALYIAAKEAYKSEVVDTEMADSIIGEDGYFSTPEEWIEARVTEWLEEAELERDA